MQIREGAYYRTRGGHVVGPMKKTDDCMQDDYPWSSMYECWTDTGQFNIADDECEADLISEVYVSDTPPGFIPIGSLIVGGSGGGASTSAPAPETKTMRDEFALEAMKKLLPDGTPKQVAESAYEYADAMMEARKK